MLFVVRFTDKPECLSIRKQFLSAHLHWLEQHQKIILVAGSLRHEPNDAPIGACWLVDAHDKAEIEALMVSDPFWTEGLRQSVEIHYWSKAFPERRTPV